jgi:pyrroline-5-carboxylate reductase
MNSNPDSQIIAFIGGGNMARSIVGGLVSSGWDASRIRVADPVQEQRSLLEDKFGISCFEENGECIQDAGIVVLAVKPQMLRQAIESMKSGLIQTKPLVISIAAGIRMSAIFNWIGGKVPMIRVMPNTPALVNCGISGMLAGAGINNAHRSSAEQVMSAVGPVIWVNSESDIDTVTGISGSGPAYYFKLMEIMIDAAVSNGLGQESARKLVLHTALGAAKLAIDSEFGPAELRRHVTSPGGTTEAAIMSMEAEGIDMTVKNGIQAAIEKSDELAKSLGEE